MVPDNHLLPGIEDILADCAKGQIWAKIDVTNSFFQTQVHPNDINLTAVTTPFRLYKWVVMHMGFRNAPATHQRQMRVALHPFIGKICHVYLEDIIIWLSSVVEHLRNVETILESSVQTLAILLTKKDSFILHSIRVSRACTFSKRS